MRGQKIKVIICYESEIEKNLKKPNGSDSLASKKEVSLFFETVQQEEEKTYKETQGQTETQEQERLVQNYQQNQKVEENQNSP